MRRLAFEHMVLKRYRISEVSCRKFISYRFVTNQMISRCRYFRCTSGVRNALELKHFANNVFRKFLILESSIQGPRKWGAGAWPSHFFQKTKFFACRIYTLSPKVDVASACPLSTLKVNARPLL